MREAQIRHRASSLEGKILYWNNIKMTSYIGISNSSTALLGPWLLRCLFFHFPPYLSPFLQSQTPGSAKSSVTPPNHNNFGRHAHLQPQNSTNKNHMSRRRLLIPTLLCSNYKSCSSLWTRIFVSPFVSTEDRQKKNRSTISYAHIPFIYRL